MTVDSTGRAIALWYRYNGNEDIIQSSTSLNGGAWSTPVDLSAVGGNAVGQQLTVDSTGLVTAVWDRDNGTETIIQSSTSLDGGAWSTPVDLSAVGQSAFWEIVTTDSTGRATAMWLRSDGTNRIMQASTSVSGGAWSTPVDLSANGEDASYPVLTVSPTGLVTAAWCRKDGADNRLQTSTSLNGGTWTTPVNLTAAGQYSGDAVLVVDSTGLVTAMSALSGGPLRSSSSLNGGSWSTLVLVAVDGDSQKMAADSTGRITALFNDYTDQYNIKSSFLESGSGGASLAATGVNAGLPLGIAAALVLSGTALVVLRRRTKKA